MLHGKNHQLVFQMEAQMYEMVSVKEIDKYIIMYN